MALVQCDTLFELEQAKDHADHIYIEREQPTGFASRWVCDACGEAGAWGLVDVEQFAVRHAFTEQNPGGPKS